MPKREAEEFLEQPVPEQTVRRDTPIIRARVVYLGAKRNESVALPGSILTEHFEDAQGSITRRVLKQPNLDPKDPDNYEERQFIQTRKAVTGGIQSYDFSTHDVKGNLIRDAGRIMPDSAPERLRGRRFEWVEHPVHLVEFYLGPRDAKDPEHRRRKDDFVVMVKPEDQAAFQEYVRRATRSEKRSLVDLQEVTSGG